MCGFSVYEKDSDEIKFTDKYYCRQIKDDRIADEVSKFFSNGISLRKSVIAEVIS